MNRWVVLLVGVLLGSWVWVGINRPHLLAADGLSRPEYAGRG